MIIYYAKVTWNKTQHPDLNTTAFYIMAQIQWPDMPDVWIKRANVENVLLNYRNTGVKKRSGELARRSSHVIAQE